MWTTPKASTKRRRRKRIRRRRRDDVSFIISVEFHTHILASIWCCSTIDGAVLLLRILRISFWYIHGNLSAQMYSIDYNFFFFIWIIKPGKGWGRIAFDRISQTICDAENNAGRNEVDSRLLCKKWMAIKVQRGGTLYVTVYVPPAPRRRRIWYETHHFAYLTNWARPQTDEYINR